MRVSFVFAMDRNRLIGRNNALPWRLPADLAYFKQVTMGHVVVMGRKTFESIGKPLPGRRNIVITRSSDFTAEGCVVAHTVDETLRLCKGEEEIFVIGGAEIYRLFMDVADRLYITEIDEQFEGDTYFPEVRDDEWKLISKTKGEKNEKNPYDYYFAVYDRI